MGKEAKEKTRKAAAGVMEREVAYARQLVAVTTKGLSLVSH